MNELKRKLSSRKLWAAIAGFVAGLVVMFGGTQEEADKTKGCIMSGGSVVSYIVAEGFADGMAAKRKKEGENNES